MGYRPPLQDDPILAFTRASAYRSWYLPHTLPLSPSIPFPLLPTQGGKTRTVTPTGMRATPLEDCANLLSLLLPAPSPLYPTEISG